ncbi:GNAT family N-acetyltransferase [Alkalihalobacillus oceani]|nr:GNAT family N-acetyltransferase [Halalkalibacter oceani]MCM3760004.1 GNAT family N-acetyltransferase [Halalkalibacter oceani]
MASMTIRRYTMEDYPQLLDLQKEAFPPPFPPELWWSPEQIQAHVDTFPAGALLAEIDGTVVGSATSLLTTYNGKPHTWAEIADNGYIRASHEPDGDSLYGIDVCVRPSFRGQGVAKALYEARKQLVRELGLARFLAGCRIPDYHKYADTLSPDEYVKAVERQEIKDLVLSFMLKQGLTPLQVLPNYVDDDESLHNAVLVEWNNKSD